MTQESPLRLADGRLRRASHLVRVAELAAILAMVALLVLVPSTTGLGQGAEPAGSSADTLARVASREVAAQRARPVS
ncbi:hypothetical protein [Thermaurantiacus sp.]